MVTLILIGIFIIPVVINILFAYLCFRKDCPGEVRTVEGLVDYCNGGVPIPLLVVPGFSALISVIVLMCILTYPIQILVLKGYEKIKHKKI